MELEKKEMQYKPAEHNDLSDSDSDDDEDEKRRKEEKKKRMAYANLFPALA